VAVLVEHVGSTSVPGLAAKPIIDVLLLVPDPADEVAYVPSLEAAGFLLHLREPDWHQHRVLKAHDPEVNLHVFAEGSEEAERMLLFRDRLRADGADRRRYEETKRRLAARNWSRVQDYADAKSHVVEAIIARTTNANVRSVLGSAAQPLGLAALLLALDASLPGRPRRLGRNPWRRRRPQRLLEQLHEAIARSAAVAQLGTVLGCDDHDLIAKTGQHSLLELVGEGVRPGKVE